MTTKKDQGGPAFPLPEPRTPSFASGVSGLTKRDWFAGQALAGELASWRSSTDGHELAIARRAFAIADAMIEARK